MPDSRTQPPLALPVLALLVACAPARAGSQDPQAAAEPAPSDGPALPAEAERLLHELDRLAAKGAWKGVERTYAKLLALGVQLPAAAHRTGGDAARSRGDATEAQRRYLKAERLEPTSTNEALDQYRSAYGVLEVRRVEATCISLTPAERPFDPSHAAAIDFAAEALSDTGAFRGLVPAGDYTVGSTSVSVEPGMRPVVVKRSAGDSDCRG